LARKLGSCHSPKRFKGLIGCDALTSDAKTWLYYKETVTATSFDSDYMTIEFRGSGIVCKGAMKADHGMFSSEVQSGGKALY
jgi:hypothetical protein